MGRESYALMTGLFVLILGGTLVLVAWWLGQYGESKDTYMVTTQSAVSGLKPESTVYYRGVAAGKVKSMGFDQHDARTIQVLVELNKGIPITTATFARLRLQPLTGLAQIELDNDAGAAQPMPTSKKNPAVIQLRPSLVDMLANSGQDLLGQAQQLMGRVNDVLGDDNRGRLGQILRNLEAVTGRLDQTLAELPAVSGDARRVLGSIDQLAGDMRDTVQRLRGLGDAGDGLAKTTLPRLNATLEELQAAAAQVKKLSAQIDQDPQALLLGPPMAAPGPGEPGYKETR